MTDEVAELRERNRTTWEAGEWDQVADLVRDVGPRLLDRVGIEEGMDVLDVGTGSGGSVSIPAALRGARVVGSDLTSQHFDDGRRRAREAGVEVDWVEADAESLPFDDASFDRVLSTFGHMFAPRHAQAAAELARVCRPGGIVGTCTWASDGWAGEMFKTVGGYMSAPPDFAQPSSLWGDEAHVREVLEPHGLALEFDREIVVFEKPSVEEFVTFYEEKFGPMVSAKAALGDRWPELRRDIVALDENWNTADDGSCRIEAQYLVTVGRKDAGR
jgi:ubiquinone/menaquinone biosynthesis C-methylase UbiE